MTCCSDKTISRYDEGNSPMMVDLGTVIDACNFMQTIVTVNGPSSHHVVARTLDSHSYAILTIYLPAEVTMDTMKLDTFDKLVAMEVSISSINSCLDF